MLRSLLKSVLQKVGLPMFLRILFVVWISLLLIKGHAQSEQSLPTIEAVWQKGMNVTHSMESGRGYGTSASKRSLEKLKDLNVEWVAIIPFCYQPIPERATIIFMDLSDPRCTSEAGVRQTIRDAHKLGFKVLLKPHLWVGYVGKRHTIKLYDNREREGWFENYEQLLLYYAKLAKEESVEILCIGVELQQLTLPFEKRWRSMIRKVREVYPGPLVYAANWDEEFEKLPFWDMLNYMGLDYYFPLTFKKNTTLSDLVKRTEMIAQKIERVQHRWGKPVIFTEVGFKSTPRAAWKTWEWEQPGMPVDMKIQAQCYHAVFEVYRKKPWFFGMYWWRWSSDPREGGQLDGGFTPNEKPAEQIIQRWYSNSP